MFSPYVLSNLLQVQQHIRTEHFGSGVGADPPLQPPTDLSTPPIFGLTGYEVQPAYQEMLNEHHPFFAMKSGL